MKNVSGLLFPVLLLCAQPSHALDSYRYLHVTINTPWEIFLFLLMGIFSPFILMAILAWRSMSKKDEEDTTTSPPAE